MSKYLKFFVVKWSLTSLYKCSGEKKKWLDNLRAINYEIIKKPFLFLILLFELTHSTWIQSPKMKSPQSWACKFFPNHFKSLSWFWGLLIASINMSPYNSVNLKSKMANDRNERNLNYWWYDIKIRWQMNHRCSALISFQNSLFCCEL